MPILPFPALQRCLCAVLLATAASAALAEPDAPVDAVSRFLVDNGLVDAVPEFDATVPPAPRDESAFIRRVRDGASGMVVTAMNFLGVPYRRGGVTASDGFDCSGFTRHVFELSLGLVLPRRADEQADAQGLIRIGRDELRPGDLVFFNTLRRTFSHVGIYVGEGKFIHSPRTGGEVRVENMSLAYWAHRFTGARRVESTPTASTTRPPPVSALQAIH